jgi:hypothetical protein
VPPAVVTRTTGTHGTATNCQPDLGGWGDRLAPYRGRMIHSFQSAVAGLGPGDVGTICWSIGLVRTSPL